MSSKNRSAMPASSPLACPLDAAAAVGEHEPARDLEARRGHRLEVGAHLVEMRGDAGVTVPLVAAEVAAVVRLALEDRPGIVDAGDHISRAVIVYLKCSGSRLSRRAPPTSACGYIRNGSGFPVDPGSATSCASLKAIQFVFPRSEQRFARLRDVRIAERRLLLFEHQLAHVGGIDRESIRSCRPTLRRGNAARS